MGPRSPRAPSLPEPTSGRSCDASRAPGPGRAAPQPRSPGRMKPRCCQRCCQTGHHGLKADWLPGAEALLASGNAGAPGGIRTPNLLIRSQMLYPLSHGCWAADRPRGPTATSKSSEVSARGRIQRLVTRQSALGQPGYRSSVGPRLPPVPRPLSGWGPRVTLLFVVIVVIIVALVFDFTNGFHDSANSMAGPIATGALKPRTAVVLAAVLNLVGACLSTEVAKTISGGFFDEGLVTAPIVLAGLVGAIIWNLLTWLVGLPSSSSHALFGGLIGAVVVGAGISTVNGSVIVSKVLLPAIVAPLVAGTATAIATRLSYLITS